MSRVGNSYLAPWLRVTLALLAVALVYASTLAARNGLADIYAEPAKSFLDDKRDAGDTLTETEWQAIHANLRKALNLAPNNPDTLRELGRLHRLQLESDTLDRAEAERHGEFALDYYEQATMLRPVWPWNWSSQAVVRYELFQDTSDAYHQALIHATHFGPWEGLVQRLVTELGIDSWTDLSPDAQQAVLVTVDRALQRQPAELLLIVDTEQAWRTLCRAATPVATAVAPAGGKADELLRLRGHCEELALH